MKGWLVAFGICAISALIIAGLWQIRNDHYGFSNVCISFIVSCP